MAEATITHFQEFEPAALKAFARYTMRGVGLAVYDSLERGTPQDVTVISLTAGPGSMTSATAGTEVKIDLDSEEWSLDEFNDYKAAQQAAEARCRAIKQQLGLWLLGGVNNERDAIVNVWVRQFPATGWYGEGYTRD